MIPQLKSIFNKNQWVQIQNWVNGRLSLKTDKFDASNIATGTSTVTLNTSSGVVTFTDTITAGDTYTSFSISNNLVTASSVISFSFLYSPSGDEMCFLSAYECGNGTITLYINNFSGIDATNNIIVSFQILN